MNNMGFTFDFAVKETPKEILERVIVGCLYEASNHLLKASLKDYSGHIQSYETTEFSTAIAELTRERTVFHDIQRELGELKKKYYTFELVIESTILESFLYRVLFLRYGEECYPATVVVADAISRQLSLVELKSKGDQPYIYEVRNPEEMEKLACAILNSRAFRNTMQQAITASLITAKNNESDNKM